MHTHALFTWTFVFTHALCMCEHKCHYFFFFPHASSTLPASWYHSHVAGMSRGVRYSFNQLSKLCETSPEHLPALPPPAFFVQLILLPHIKGAGGMCGSSLKNKKIDGGLSREQDFNLRKYTVSVLCKQLQGRPRTQHEQTNSIKTVKGQMKFNS